jgi:hypothetical protein
MMLSFQDFLKEQHIIVEGKGDRNVTTVYRPTSGKGEVPMNHSDETLEGLRRALLDHYFEKVGSNNENSDTVNKCVSTYVYALGNNLKIDEEIVILLAKTVGEDAKDTRETLSKITRDFYGEKSNIYG